MDEAWRDANSQFSEIPTKVLSSVRIKTEQGTCQIFQNVLTSGVPPSDVSSHKPGNPHLSEANFSLPEPAPSLKFQKK